jgi:hypothetical protein
MKTHLDHAQQIKMQQRQYDGTTLDRTPPGPLSYQRHYKNLNFGTSAWDILHLELSTTPKK